jgi:hypothetical protein
MINVNIIRIFDGPVHQRLEQIWRHYKKHHEFNLHVFDNTKLQLRHDVAYNEIWRKERNRGERFAIFTEFDFLPGPGFLSTSIGDSAVKAAEYCTRNSDTMELEWHGIPGAWFILIDKEWTPPLDFSSAGPFNDPANGLPADLIHSEDCYPEHYGCRVGQKGEHLFFSRHYNDSPELKIAGLPLDDILKKIKIRLDNYTHE